MTSLESLIEDVLFANDDDAARRVCQAIYALGQKEAKSGIKDSAFDPNIHDICSCGCGAIIRK